VEKNWMKTSLTGARRKIASVLSISGGLFVILCSLWLIRLAANPQREKLKTLSQAQARWAAHSISSYQMVIAYTRKQYGQDAGTCQEQVEVQNNSIVVNSTAQQTCRSQTLTIPDLFQQIERDTNVIRWNQCHILIVTVTDDMQFGYPSHIKYRWENASFDNLGMDYFKVNCQDLAMFPPDIDDIEIISLISINP
jgi:hypothetical protein